MHLEKRFEYEDFITNYADDREAMLSIYEELTTRLQAMPEDPDTIELIAEVLDCLDVLEEEEEFKV